MIQQEKKEAAAGHALHATYASKTVQEIYQKSGVGGNRLAGSDCEPTQYALVERWSPGRHHDLVAGSRRRAGMETPFMEYFAGHIADTGMRVIRFEFPYMQQQRLHGRRRPPNSTRVLLDTWRQVIDDVRQDGWGGGKLAIGGKSMGGRLASMIADDVSADALICLGFPFQAPGKSQPERLQSLQQITTPTLIIQGTRDPFGDRAAVASFRLAPSVEVCWLEDGNHDFVPRKSSGRTTQQNWQEAVARIVSFSAS